MKLIKRNELRILYPKYGYLLRNKETKDVYVGKVYLGKNSSVEDFEEIRNKNVDESLLNTIQEVEENSNVLLDTMQEVEINNVLLFDTVQEIEINNDILMGTIQEIEVNNDILLGTIQEVEETNNKLQGAIQEVEAKEQSLNKIGKIVANQVQDDTIALSIQEFYDIWQSGITYTKDQYINYNEVLYKVLQNHTSLDNWTPDVTGSLYAKVLVDPTGETILEWVQPDSTNPYMKGDKVNYNGLTYESTVDNNVWAPGVYGWQVV